MKFIRKDNTFELRDSSTKSLVFCGNLTPNALSNIAFFQAIQAVKYAKDASQTRDIMLKYYQSIVLPT